MYFKLKGSVIDRKFRLIIDIMYLSNSVIENVNVHNDIETRCIS